MCLVVLIFHILVTLMMIGLILLQRGEEITSGTGGGSYNPSLGGRSGGANLLSRATTICASLFFMTNLFLAILVRKESTLKNPETAFSLSIDSVA